MLLGEGSLGHERLGQHGQEGGYEEELLEHDWSVVVWCGGWEGVVSGCERGLGETKAFYALVTIIMDRHAGPRGGCHAPGAQHLMLVWRGQGAGLLCSK